MGIFKAIRKPVEVEYVIVSENTIEEVEAFVSCPKRQMFQNPDGTHSYDRTNDDQKLGWILFTTISTIFAKSGYAIVKEDGVVNGYSPEDFATYFDSTIKPLVSPKMTPEPTPVPKKEVVEAPAKKSAAKK